MNSGGMKGCRLQVGLNCRVLFGNPTSAGEAFMNHRLVPCCVSIMAATAEGSVSASNIKLPNTLQCG